MSNMLRYDQIRQMHIELSSRCNAACPGCPRNVMGGYTVPWIDKKEWNITDFKKIFPEELIARCRFILFCGNYGDPGTNKDLVEILKYVKSCNWEGMVRVHTNGGMRTPKFWASVAEVLNPNRDSVIWSIDGLEDTNHIYRRLVDWKKLKANFTAYIEAGGNATWEYLVFGHNQHQVEQAKQLSEEWGFSAFWYKKAFGFTEEENGTGLTSMVVLDKEGNEDYKIPAPDDNWLNNLTLELTKQSGTSDTKKIHNFDPETYKKHIAREKESLKDNIRNGHLSWLDSAKHIDCMSIRNQEIYVDSLGGVHPCCFLGHVSQDADGIVNMQYYQWLEENIGIENINAHTYGIEHILNETDYFKKIEDTWAIDKHADGRIAQCTKHCQTLNNPIESLYESVRKQEKIREEQRIEQGLTLLEDHEPD